MKRGRYLKHDVSASTNRKLMLLMQEEGIKGYGFYWLLLETLCCQPQMCAPMGLLRTFAYRYRTKVAVLRRVVECYDLFVIDGDTFRSPGLDKRMKPFIDALEASSSSRVEPQDPSKLLKMSEGVGHNAQEREKRRKEYSNSKLRREIAADSVTTRIVGSDTESLPLMSIHSWERFVDEMAADTFWMELVGMRSGLGQLYIDHRAEIVELFRQHIRLYDKGGGLLRLQDVKQYFANYLAAGSRTCQGVRDRLLDDIRRRQASAGVSPYETIVDGRRTYLGRPIPDDAPPRPDEFSVWDEEKKKWTR